MGKFIVAKEGKVIAIIDPSMRRSLERLLSARGYRTELFPSVEDFLQVAPTTKADCLVIDIQLGTTSGIDLGHELLAKEFQSPVIFVTLSDNPAIRAQLMKLGSIAYIYNPFPPDQLILAIEKALMLNQEDTK